MGKTVAFAGLGVAGTDAGGGWDRCWGSGKRLAGGWDGQQDIGGRRGFWQWQWQGVMEKGLAVPWLCRLQRKMHFHLCALKLEFFSMAYIYISGWHVSHWSARMKMVFTDISSSAFHFLLLNPWFSNLWDNHLTLGDKIMVLLVKNKTQHGNSLLTLLVARHKLLHLSSWW